MMFNQELAEKIDALIKEKFPMIYEYKFDGIVLLCSGAIRNIIMGIPVKDLDFVILTQEEDNTLDFIKKYKLRYEKNHLDSYKIFFNNTEIDMFSVDDLLEATVYDMDMLFYDIEKHMFISCGAIVAIENRTITQINKDSKINYANKNRVKKIGEFIKFITKNNKRVKLRQNKLLWCYKSFVQKIKINLNEIYHGNLKKCLRFVENCKKKFIIIIILGILISLLSLIEPAISGMVVSNLMNNKYNIIFILILVMLFARALILILQFIMSKLYLVINKTMVNNIRKEILNSVLNLEIENFNDNNRGAFLEKLSNDPKAITDNFNAIKDVLIRGIGNVGLIIYMFVLDYRIGLVLCFFTIVIFCVIIKGIRKKRRYRIKYYKSQEKYSSILGEMINGVDDIKNLDLKENYTKKTISSFERVSENEYQANYYQKVYKKLVGFIELIAILIILLFGLYLVKKGLLVVSSLVIIFMYNSTIFAFVSRIGLLMDLLNNLNISCDRIFGLLDGDTYKNEVFGNKYKNRCNGIIEFDNVKFKYDYKNNYVINDCTFKVNSNELVAIVGKSGEGKTTILNLLSRLYSVDSGNILIDGVVINEYSEKFIRDNIAVISQSPYLFDMSIKDNLKLVKEDITDKAIVDVCKMVCLDEFIESLPNKYDTIIGEGGVKLSGGQKQRLGIARALIKHTKIILLDEITSALDNETSTIIKKVISNIKKNHTIIIVTHELSMIKDSSRILVLDNGKIVGDGTHNQLLKNNAIYKKLYKIK